MSSKYNKVALLIMDGWGKEVDKARSAIFKAQTPNVDAYYTKYPNTTLITFGEDVGLPVGQMGNSEVGHMNLGAGRIVYQELARINKAVNDNSLAQNPELAKTFAYALSNEKPLHLMGLVSDGGVHSHMNHCIGLAKMANQAGIKEIYIHAFTDGRDCAPDSGIDFLMTLEDKLVGTGAKVASVIGRYYAMDRDKRWERIQKAYNLLVKSEGEKFHTVQDAMKSSYKEDISDEFILPKVIVDEQNNPIAKIQEEDAVICFNFRTDRCREITTVLTQQDMPAHKMSTLPLYFVTMSRYDDTFKKVHVLLENDNLSNTLGEVLAKAGKTQLRMAETEKYPHVTFFFSGGREKEFEGESREVIPSPKVATYDMQPEMSAVEVKDKALEQIQQNQPDFICLNFANTDMVGHTGIFKAAMKAAETVDSCVNDLVEELLKHNYAILLTADHGNADIMQNEDGTPHTSHTKNLVPLFFITREAEGKLKQGKLGDIAPTILTLMGIEPPKEMTGDLLLN